MYTVVDILKQQHPFVSDWPYTLSWAASRGAGSVIVWEMYVCGLTTKKTVYLVGQALRVALRTQDVVVSIVSVHLQPKHHRQDWEALWNRAREDTLLPQAW